MLEDGVHCHLPSGARGTFKSANFNLFGQRYTILEFLADLMPSFICYQPVKAMGRPYKALHRSAAKLHTTFNDKCKVEEVLQTKDTG